MAISALIHSVRCRPTVFRTKIAIRIDIMLWHRDHDRSSERSTTQSSLLMEASCFLRTTSFGYMPAQGRVEDTNLCTRKFSLPAILLLTTTADIQ
jgi:hypothetical protein